ncbi:MAG: PEPxxWA-CTERM sorting domain-containing protein [Sphingomonas sp.]|uniref:PEPxxWA-CTERM sorting domain-containing protein n=1 Tax=Sphingomonas sp. TaxID=28214 RepID=UPI001AD1D732|nr:PEPxxWA-CTERM sorting domain-containing protein [Sphingomonas sp.]MBN8816606.1 PEPxxWA-CTERM sorting domain-containing protein [Sphingomonas sp.]
MKLWQHTGLIAIALGGISLAAAPANAQTIVADAVNDGIVPDYAHWGLNNMGWYYTPTTSYLLTGIGTRFAEVDGRTVTEYIYSGTVGHLTLLSSGSFTASTNFVTPVFTPVALVSGTQYFIGFDNLAGLGSSITDASGSSDRLGRFYAGFGATGNPAYETFAAQSTGRPILQFYTSAAAAGVPEPATWALMLLGFGALGGVLRSRPNMATRVRFA